MSADLIVRKAGPAITVQDLGRPGHAAEGLSRGGAMDRLALAEAAALLSLPAPVAALEMGGLGGAFEVTAPMLVALTGAEMAASRDGERLRWNAAHLLQPGQVLTIGGARRGSYGYLTLAGGLRSAEFLGSRSAHLAAGIGRPVAAGDRLPLGDDPDPSARPVALQVEDRSGGGTVRMIEGPQTGFFATKTLERFLDTRFRRAAAGNRQGIALDHDGAPFAADGASGLVSDPIIAGDIQLTGAGTPTVLMAECQTIGGYPRIGTVLPCDLPLLAQAAPGDALRFRMVTLDEADRLLAAEAAIRRDLRRRVGPLVRDPRDIGDLLGYQLISGVTCGDDLERS
ncbi:MAG: biotin-dependent carboxyltransferase family protein [Sedimentitalea sp.]|nr:biotin-dependent carboxyltransferase family protein [Sedimentitalea sp.]